MPITRPGGESARVQLRSVEEIERALETGNETERWVRLILALEGWGDERLCRLLERAESVLQP